MKYQLKASAIKEIVATASNITVARLAIYEAERDFNKYPDLKSTTVSLWNTDHGGSHLQMLLERDKCCDQIAEPWELTQVEIDSIGKEKQAA